MRPSGHAAAARALDNSEEVVREHYSYIEADELADRMTSVFEQADQQGESTTTQSTDCGASGW